MREDQEQFNLNRNIVDQNQIQIKLMKNQNPVQATEGMTIPTQTLNQIWT